MNSKPNGNQSQGWGGARHGAGRRPNGRSQPNGQTVAPGSAAGDLGLILPLLDDIRAHQIRLEEALGARLRRIEALLEPQSDGFDLEALSGVAAAIGGEKFTAADLSRRADADGESELARLLDDAAGGISPASLGRWLVRVENSRTSGGAVLIGDGRGARGKVYRFRPSE